MAAAGESRIDAVAVVYAFSVHLCMHCVNSAMAEVQAKVPAEAVSVADKSHGVDKDVLIARLDTLLETYLHTLDEYEKLMQQLSKKLSSVCLTPIIFSCSY